MTTEELDILWSRALRDSVAAGEMYTRYRFAALVAAAEREECAKVCDQQAHEPECPERATYCAAAIRARGKHDTQGQKYADRPDVPA